ncbi:hypothetical protein ACFQ3Z_34940 [Streptomyces nogalater]
MPIDRTVFTHAMAQVPAPVTVVTTVTPKDGVTDSPRAPSAPCPPTRP